MVSGLLIIAAIAVVNELGWHWGALAQQGPFLGEAYAGNISGKASSRMILADQVVLRVYELEPGSASLLCLDAPGKSWIIRMIAHYPDDPDQSYSIRKVDLVAVRQSESGYKVLYSADWDFSGEESGMIFLTDTFDLKHFTLR